MKPHSSILLCLMLVFSVVQATADDFNFEVGLSTNSSRMDFAAVSIDETVTTDGYDDNDELALTGIWYFNGLSDASGPRARAVFLSRASSLSLRYSRGDREVDATVNPPPPLAVSSRLETTTDTVVAGLRYVSRESGWFGTASVGFLSEKYSTGHLSDTDATLYTAGLGKYVGDSTAVEVNIGRTDIYIDDATTYRVALTHVGSLGEQWQYALDAAYSWTNSPFDDERFILRPALYPNSDVELGLALTHQEFSGVGEIGVSGFASWFVRPNVMLNAHYGSVDDDELPGVDTDNYSFGIGIDVRF